MKRYTYFVSLGKKQFECPNVDSAVKFINEVIGCDLVSSSMVFNYFENYYPRLILYWWRGSRGFLSLPVLLTT